MRQRRLAIQVGRARLQRRPPLRRRRRELLAGGVTARPTIPRPAVWRQADLLEDLLDLLGRRLVAIAMHREHGAHRDGHPFGQHRPRRPRRLGRAHDLAAPEQLLARTEQRMVETPLARQDVDEHEIDLIDAHRPRDRLELAQAPDLAEAAARMAFLHEQVERQPPRGAPEAAPFFGNAAEVERLLLDAHAALAQDDFELRERDRGIDVRPALGDAHAGIHDRRVPAVHRLQVARLGRDRRRHRGEEGHQLGVLHPHRLDDHGTGAADDRAPTVVRQQLPVLLGDQLVPQDAAVYGAVTGGVAGVYHLLWGGRVEVRLRLDAQDQHRVAPHGERQGAGLIAVRGYGVVGTGWQADAAARARVVHDRDALLLHRDRVGGTDPDAGEACDAFIRIDPKIQERTGRARGTVGRAPLRCGSAPAASSELVFLQLAIQCALTDAEHLGGLAPVAVRLL